MATSSYVLICLLVLFVSNSNSFTSDQDVERSGLLSFKNGADPKNILNYNSSSEYCKWQGVECSSDGNIINFEVENLNLQGIFPSHSLSTLTQLKTINLSNNSLSGPIPNLSSLKNLKALLLSQNKFSGSFPAFILILDRLVALSLSHNNLNGTLPFELTTALKNIITINLSYNNFSGYFPPLNQSNLRILDVSNNNFSGALPSTKILSLFKPASFANNSFLCGEIIHKECPAPPPLPPHHHHHRHNPLLVALIITFIILVIISIFIIIVMKKQNKLGGAGNFFKRHMEMVKLGG